MTTSEAIEITKGFLRFNNKACSQAPTQVEIEAITSILSILDSARAGEHAKSLQESPESYRLDALDWRTEPNTSEQMALHCEQQVSACEAGAAALSLVPQLQERVRVLKEALVSYAQHHITCALQEPYELDDIQACTCGLENIFKGDSNAG